MSLYGRFDSVFAIFRGSGATDDYGDASHLPPELVAEYDGLMTSPHDINLNDVGAGEFRLGYRTMMFEEGADIQDNDIIYVRRGPEKGTWWRFQYNSAPHGRHSEGYVLPYRGPTVAID
jgi:hypothetical protein